MAVNEWSNIGWSGDEPLDTDRLNQMVNNIKYLRDRAPILKFSSYAGAMKDSGVKIACGVATVPPIKANSQYIRVEFGGFFTAGCKPVVVCSLTSYQNGRVHVVTHSIDSEAHVPDHRGFRAKVQTNEMSDKYNTFLKTMYINWIAMGY